MPKITISDITDSGFRAEQFPPAADFLTPATGYLARVITLTEATARTRVGNTAYDATTVTSSVAYYRLHRAELNLAKAELWRRRAAFVDGNASHASEQSPERNRAEYFKHASECDALADAAIAEFIADGDGPATGLMADFSLGVVESGRFTATVV
jgi:hypothetical protein